MKIKTEYSESRDILKEWKRTRRKRMACVWKLAIDRKNSDAWGGGLRSQKSNRNIESQSRSEASVDGR